MDKLSNEFDSNDKSCLKKFSKKPGLLYFSKILITLHNNIWVGIDQLCTNFSGFNTQNYKLY